MLTLGPMSVRARALLAAAAIPIGSAGYVALAATASDGRPAASTPAAAQVATGATLAAIGNCMVCHTAEGGKPYAGGRPLSTPFGTIYATNITPDRETGIGRWSEAEFLRAMHDGVDRAGRQLYPAFPYDHFTKVRADDVQAIYAFIMSREPVRATAPSNNLIFPLQFRPLVAPWKWLFLDRGEYVSDPSKDETWNRGAYLVEGLAHCGACHTPRNVLGAEKKRDAFAGGETEGWSAPALNGANPAPIAWTADQVFNYLRYGSERQHGAAAGPMEPVVHNLARVPEADVRAIAAYVASLSGGTASARPAQANAIAAAESNAGSAVAGPAATARNEGNAVSAATTAAEDTASASSEDVGASVFAGACASCHHVGSTSPAGGTIPLSVSTTVNAPDPRNLIHIVRDGLWPRAGAKGPLMPGFANALTDAQIAAVAVYVRTRFSKGRPWRDVDQTVREIAGHKLS